MSAVLKVVEKEGMENKTKALDAALAQIERAFGKGSIMKLGQRESAGPRHPRHLHRRDLGHRPRARHRQGHPQAAASSRSSARNPPVKTTLSPCTVAAQAQKKPAASAAVIDAEHALDPTWAKRIGVNIDDLLVSQPDSGEQALEICRHCSSAPTLSTCIIIDSVAALIAACGNRGRDGRCDRRACKPGS